MAACSAEVQPGIQSAAIVPIQLAATGGHLSGPVIESSAYGDYLAGLVATRERDLSAAADYMGRALQSDPDNRELLYHAFLLYAADGRHDQAARLAARVVEKSPHDSTAKLVLAIDRVEQGDPAGAIEILDSLPNRDRDLSKYMVPMLGAWLYVGQQDIEAGLVKIAALKDAGEPSMHYFLHVALMNDVAGRPAEAEAAYRAALDVASRPSLRLTRLAGNFFQRQGDKAAAAEIYRQFKNAEPGSTLLDGVIAKLGSDSPPAPVVANYKAGLAEVLFDISRVLSEQRALEQALIQVHLALRLKPGFDRARILLGEVMESQGRDEEAVAVYREIRRDTPLGWVARLRIAEALERLERDDEAIRVLEGLAAERPGHYEPLFRVGNMLRAQERFAEAVNAYDRAFERLTKTTSPHWTMHYYRGIALERSGQWARAERDLMTALDLEPDQPYVMNYLAYSWVEQKTRLDEAQRMLTKAVELKPKDGYITDSLGWVYFRLGDYKNAVIYLERAVELRPQDPVINDHLGDAYWRTGRRQEARFQWRRALSLKPEPDLVPTINAKIERGLGVNAKNI